MNESLKNIIDTIPSSPGVYQYFNREGIVIYVGKAKNLKKRVSSYFIKDSNSVKTNILVSKICDIKYICVDTEVDALLLENNLIKKYQPRYNILLKDGKTYPWICITKEPFPRVFKTRNVMRGADYFGPFPSTYTIDLIIELIRQIFPLRTCNQAITLEGVEKNRYKVCLQYHIKNCLAPCVALQSPSEYMKMIDEIRHIVKGKSHIISDFLLQQMKDLSVEYKFEEAHKIKQKYDLIVQFQQKTVITTTSDNDIDVFGYDDDEQSAYINILRISSGSVIQGLTVEYKKTLDESKEEILSLAILELREKFKSITSDVVVPFLPDTQLDNIKYLVPQRGDKKKLLDLSIKNVKQFRVDKYKQSEKLNPEQRSLKLLTDIKSTLYLDKLPVKIECFDNSNISGTDAVAACVVYLNGKPSKKDYRKYIIKSVVGADDYASMSEVVFRRYSRMIEEGTPLPDLILTDGGKGQMEVVRKVLVEQLNIHIPIVGLVKNSKHTTSSVLVGSPAREIDIKPTDYIFKFLAGVQNQVHGFAIAFHRDKRSKSQTRSQLDEIAGVGEKTKNLLLNRFKSVKKISLASFDELKEIIGNTRATVVYNHFNPK
ncbi:MAG: excinuclease ABC subunit UvrC [bacterium]